MLSACTATEIADPSRDSCETEGRDQIRSYSSPQRCIHSAVQRIALKLRRLGWFVTNERLPQLPGAASFKRVLDGELFLDGVARRARPGGRVSWSWKAHFLHPTDRRRCACAPDLWRIGVVGRSEPKRARAHQRSAPRPHS